MHFLGVLLLAASTQGVESPPSLQEAAPDPLMAAKQDYLLWQSRKELAGILREQVRVRLGDKEIKDGTRFQTSYVEQQIKKLQTSYPALAAPAGTESEQLLAMLRAYEELVDVLIQIRDVAKQRMVMQQRKEAGKASKTKFSAPAPPPQSRGDSPLAIGVDVFNAAVFAADMAKWRGGVAAKANAAFNVGSIGANMADLETALRDTSSQASTKLDSACNRLVPLLVADGYVRQFAADGLIQKCARVQVIEAPAINVSECKDPKRIREVVYDVTDGFGTKRRGTVAVYQTARSEWLPSRDNELRGGFYELHLAEGGAIK